MVGAKRSYEDFRQQRLEENMKRMEELKITKLALNLQKPSPKPSPAKKPRRQIQEGGIIEATRKSSRCLNKPPPVYKEVVVERLERRKRVCKRSISSNRAYVSDKDRLNALERAEDLDSILEGYPSFVKGMLHSHVKVGFWLGLPVQFCKRHLPKRDQTITLVDEDGEEYDTTYLAQKTGLSAGWRGFALEKDLVDGDALVFQLIKPTTFKVYIIRLNDSGEAEEAEEE